MKTNELIGAALELMVVKCETPIGGYKSWVRAEVDSGVVPAGCRYSSDWLWGGPIIEREKIELSWSGEHWTATWWADNSDMAKAPAKRFAHNRHQQGPTPLIAAMRCYVSSKMGDEVDVPEGLT